MDLGGWVLVKNGEYMSTRVKALQSSMQEMMANHPEEQPLVDGKNTFWSYSRQYLLVDWVLGGVVLVACQQSSSNPYDGGLMVGWYV